MGKTAENLHDRFPHLTKERADAFAAASQEKTAKAYADGKIQPDLVPWPPARPRTAGAGRRRRAAPPGTTLEGLAALKTPFRPHGRVTAGNAAGLNDGATACLLAAEDVADELGLRRRCAGVLRLRRRRARGHGRRPGALDREGASRPA
jgi:acetyl-CoA acyltransferase